jgi:hypothetical protein
VEEGSPRRVVDGGGLQVVGEWGVSGKLPKWLAQPEDDGALWSTATHAERDGGTEKSIARLHWLSA